MTDPAPYLMSEAEGPEALEVNRACPIEADFSFYFERDPDFFRWPRQVFDAFDYYGVRANGDLVAYAMLARRRGWVGDRWGTVGYGGDARVLPGYRRQGIADALRLAITANMPADVEVGFSIMKVGNRPVEGYIDQLAEAPPNPEWDGAMLGVFRAYNVFFVAPRGAPVDIPVRRATIEDVPEMLELLNAEYRGRLFAPAPDEQRIRRAFESAVDDVAPPEYFVAEQTGKMTGVIGFWDIDPMHRPRVLRRSWKAQAVAAGYGVLRVARPDLRPLPPAGGVFRGLAAVDVATIGRDPTVLRAMLEHGQREYAGQGLHYLQVGFMTTDPLCEALRDFRAARFESNLSTWFRRSWRERVGDDALADPLVDLTML